MARYLVGQTIELRGTFTDEDGNLANPDAVTLEVRDPDGTVSTPTPSNTSPGVWEADITLTEAGVWRYVFTGTGTVDAVDQGTVVAREPWMDLLTVDELRDHIPTDLADEEVQRLLDAAMEAIIEHAGAPSTTVDWVVGGYPHIALSRRASSVTSIVEDNGSTTLTLAADDYRLRAGGYVVERLDNGTNSRWSWNRLVTVTYIPVDDTSTREQVQLDLVRLALNYSPLMVSERIGQWSETVTQSAGIGYEKERGAILARLNGGPRMVVV